MMLDHVDILNGFIARSTSAFGGFQQVTNREIDRMRDAEGDPTIVVRN